jgi:hypothetical protein
MTDSDAVFIGGPQDGTVFAAPDSGLVEVPIGGLTHRYTLTTATRDRDEKPIGSTTTTERSATLKHSRARRAARLLLLRLCGCARG